MGIASVRDACLTRGHALRSRLLMPEAPTPPSHAFPSPAPTSDPQVQYSPPVGDAVKCTTCYMCACRCGIKVHLKDGRVRYIEGNPDHPVNRGDRKSVV